MQSFGTRLAGSRGKKIDLEEETRGIVEGCKAGEKGTARSRGSQPDLTSILEATEAFGGGTMTSGCLYPRSLWSARPEFKSQGALLLAT